MLKKARLLKCSISRLYETSTAGLTKAKTCINSDMRVPFDLKKFFTRTNHLTSNKTTNRSKHVI